ncbi:F-box domain-containing protein [Protomyces lactucae-debilis]|uniref:F-box domain-containing protein n=1 Tax=Protomyces lactucae-debilis TaxID=2754530 RepID=A0A1Y2FF35_PROLT|nr:F-box domain-containing protein [Protomyces lactucae-debilis]ORY82539.1 F-box domain-containing protein [Protomyces lactucae-debilis]
MARDLPADIVAASFDHLPVPDLLRAAQVSLLWRDIVYDEQRWIAKLRAIGVWSDAAARRNLEEENTNRDDPLYALPEARPVRGRARPEFRRIYKLLAPYYLDLVAAANPATSKLFTSYKDPEDQARMLRQLSAFGAAHPVHDSQARNVQLQATIDLFETAALREFEISYDHRNEASMQRYAQVCTLLNGGGKCIRLFCSKNVLLSSSLPNAFECFDAAGNINLTPMQRLTTSLGVELLSQKEVIALVFPRGQTWHILCERVLREVLAVYIKNLIDYAQQQSTEAYLAAVPGAYQHAHRLVSELGLNLLPQLQAIFEEHVSWYLEEELRELRSKADHEVSNWDRQITDESQKTESLLLSNINREAAKKNFLQSFTQVILMPVNVVGSAIPFRQSVTPDANQPAGLIAEENNLAATQSLPTTELAARAAIMNSGLARIKRLLSLEVALSLIHAGKEAIDRSRTFVPFAGRLGQEAREQSEAMFNAVLDALGVRHIANGFELALQALKSYDPRRNKQVAQVQPLVDFLELVHVGDLIQQMIDVFYNQELAGIVDKTDFLSPAVKGKKKFEEMIDKNVADGLNRGIDVLMEQVEYLLITTQKPTDFKPWLVLGQDDHLDLQETDTARQVVACLSTHTELLRGSTDKATLDVFFQEVGVRFFGSLCKHLKRQSITVEGGLKLISDLNYYYNYIASLKQSSIVPYFSSLKELGNLYIVSGQEGKAVGQLVSDMVRFGGVLRPEDVYEFAERRADWMKVKKDVDKVIYGTNGDCVVQ